MSTIVEPIELKTFNNRHEGRLSSGPDEGLILFNNSVTSSKETGKTVQSCVTENTNERAV